MFSEKVINAIENIRRLIIDNNGKIIFCAGDSILFAGAFDDTWCLKVLEFFLATVGCTASMGVGKSSFETYLALKVAKVKGGGRIAYFNSIKKEESHG